jgi:hypothetical protein
MHFDVAVAQNSVRLSLYDMSSVMTCHTFVGGNTDPAVEEAGIFHRGGTPVSY